MEVMRILASNYSETEVLSTSNLSSKKFKFERNISNCQQSTFQVQQLLNARGDTQKECQQLSINVPKKYQAGKQALSSLSLSPTCLLDIYPDSKISTTITPVSSSTSSDSYLHRYLNYASNYFTNRITNYPIKYTSNNNPNYPINYTTN